MPAAQQQLIILRQLADVTRLRGELQRLGTSPSVAKITKITPEERRTIFDLLRAIDELMKPLPGEEPCPTNS